MIERTLRDELDRVAWRYRWLRLFQLLAAGWLTVAAGGLVALWVVWRMDVTWPWAASALAAACGVAAALAVWITFRTGRDPRRLARRIEARYPDLKSLLLTAVEQEPELPLGRFGFLQETVLRDAVAHSRRHDWPEAISRRRVRRAQLAALVGLLLVVGLTAAVAGQSKRAVERAAAAIEEARAAVAPYQVTVTPGDTEIERAASLIVTARFEGRVPDDAWLAWHDGSGEVTRAAMSLSLSDPMFGGRVAGVAGDLVYRVEYDGHSTRDFHVTVYEHPRLERADARLVFPGYTGLEEKLIEDTRRVTAVEGTRLTLLCHLNKPVDSARLVPEEGEPIELAGQSDSPAVWTATLTLQQSGRYRLQLVDAEGRKNKEPPEFVFQVTPNRPADLKLTFPGRDVRVSPIEELAAAASAWDDFGLAAYGISYGLAGRPALDVVLGQSTERNERRKIEHLVDFETLQAEPDQLLSYYFWAEDVGPDGSPRRTLGDMYFAEVRHFEEIFREGQQPPSGSEQQQQQQEQGQNARQAEELAEAQKQIISATWKVIRRETAPQPTETFAGDAPEIRQAQLDALGQLGELAGNLEDAESQGQAAAVAAAMQEALTHLKESADSVSPSPLTPALAAEQAAYQGLLKLRAREHEVTRARRQSRQQSASASSAQSRAQQQLDQLELTQSENRYETERQADPQREQEERENRQVFNRLRELARRQSDLNERMKELQSALEEAETDQQREELAEELKRLRQQQRQMLDDTDELAERMSRPENQERMAESRRQLDQTRENVRQASESLSRQELSEAVTSGTRAERELSQMREEFRQRTSQRFSEEVQQLRDDARRLSENESRLREQLDELGQEQPAGNRLREARRPERLGDEFRRQQEDLGQLMEDVRQTVEEAEEAEPVMTRHLYDSLRKARQENLEETLEATGMLVDRGILEQAQEAERQAAEGIEDFRAGIEKAAESVLGSEEDALRRALRTLDDLARQLDEEIRQSDPNAAAESPSENELADAQVRPRPGEPRDGQEPRQPSDQRQPPQPSDRRQPSRSSDERGPAGQQALERFLSEQQTRGPIRGEDFLDWSDRLRDVEEMVDDVDMRAEAARIRDAARGIRLQARGGSQAPRWDLVRRLVAEPLAELRDRVAEELLRRSEKPLVPIDRDPVPSKYAEQVRRYYEELGGGQ